MQDALTLNRQSQIAKNVSLMGLSVGATMVMSLGLRMILPRLMGPEKMGIFYFADSFSTLFFAFLPLGLTTYINRTIPNNHRHTHEIFSTLVLTEGVMAALIGCLMFATLTWTNRTPETLACTFFMGVYAATFHFQRNILQKIFISIDQMKVISLVNIGVKLLLVLGCLSLLKIKPSVIWVAAMYGFSEFCGLIYLMHRAYRNRFFAEAPSLHRFQSIMKVSLPFFLAGVLSAAYTEVDTNMLAHLTTNVEVGYFGAANKLIGVFMLLVPILQHSFTPALSQAWDSKDGSFPDLVKQLMNVLLVFSLPLSIVLIFFGDYLSRLLYGSGFEASYKILCFLTPVLTMMYVNTFMAVSLNLSSTGGKISQIFVIGISLNIVLDALAIPYGAKLGPGGPGLVVSLCTFACEMFTLFAMLRAFPCKVLDFRSFKNLLVILAPCWVAMLCYDSISKLSLGYRLGFTLLTPAYALLTGLVDYSDLDRCSKIVRRMARRVA